MLMMVGFLARDFQRLENMEKLRINDPEKKLRLRNVRLESSRETLTFPPLFPHAML